MHSGSIQDAVTCPPLSAVWAGSGGCLHSLKIRPDTFTDNNSKWGFGFPQPMFYSAAAFNGSIWWIITYLDGVRRVGTEISVGKEELGTDAILTFKWLNDHVFKDAVKLHVLVLDVSFIRCSSIRLFWSTTTYTELLMPVLDLSFLCNNNKTLIFFLEFSIYFYVTFLGIYEWYCKYKEIRNFRLQCNSSCLSTISQECANGQVIQTSIEMSACLYNFILASWMCKTGMNVSRT